MCQDTTDHEYNGLVFARLSVCPQQVELDTTLNYNTTLDCDREMPGNAPGAVYY